MSSPTLPLLAAALAFSLAACSPPPADPVEPAADPADATTMPPAADATSAAMEPAAPPAMGDPCDANAAQALVGQEATDEAVEQARVDAGARTVRSMRPGEPVTMDFREDRLNVEVGEDGTITSVRCG